MILLLIITEIMEDKVTETITYIKSFSGKKNIYLQNQDILEMCNENNVWSIENLPNVLQDMCDKGLIELLDDTYKIK